MGISTLILSVEAEDDADIEFIDGTDGVVLDGTYDEYMFVMIDMQISVNSQEFQFNVSANGGDDYDVVKTTTRFYAHYREDGGGTPNVVGETVGDQAQGEGNHYLTYAQGNASDESASGILTLYAPSNTTYVKHFMARMQLNSYLVQAQEHYSAGYFNTTSAINAIKFVPASGTMNGIIQLYGIA